MSKIEEYQPPRKNKELESKITPAEEEELGRIFQLVGTDPSQVTEQDVMFIKDQARIRWEGFLAGNEEVWGPTDFYNIYNSIPETTKKTQDLKEIFGQYQFKFTSEEVINRMARTHESRVIQGYLRTLESCADIIYEPQRVQANVGLLSKIDFSHLENPTPLLSDIVAFILTQEGGKEFCLPHIETFFEKLLAKDGSGDILKQALIDAVNKDTQVMEAYTEALDKYMDQRFGKSTEGVSYFTFFMLCAELISDKELINSGRAGHVTTMFYESLIAMRELESQQPGVLATLKKDFNLDHFGRYPIEMLIKQANEGMQEGMGLAVYSKADHNGTFYSNVKWLFKQFPTDSKGTCVFETNDPIGDLPALSLKLRHLIKNGTHIPYVILSGHGTPQSIQYGRHDQEGGDLIVDEKLKEQSRLIMPLLKDTTLILQSCSTGQEIARELSELYEATAIGPSMDGDIVEFESNPKGSDELFTVKYLGDGMKTMVYKNGELLKEYQ
ncbi:MAG TPA: hypothetical protein VGO63_01255 [Candidatus Paceibacterota bacterium]|jgi:hypothetical protein|nr:hypothetical protein [Candidatus Paceibacterota bacterium]